MATDAARPSHAARCDASPNPAMNQRATICRPPHTPATPGSPVRSTSACLVRAIAV